MPKQHQQQQRHNNNISHVMQILINDLLQPPFYRSWQYWILIFIIPVIFLQFVFLICMESNHDHLVSFSAELQTSSLSNHNSQNSDTYRENVNSNDSILCGGCFLAKITKFKEEDISRTCGHYIRQHVVQSLGIMLNDNDNENEKKQKEKEQWVKIQQMQKFNKTEYIQIVRKAAYQISTDFPYNCYRCNPAACAAADDDDASSTSTGSTSSVGSTYYSYDVTAPKIQKSWTYYLDSIPQVNRYPLDGLKDPDKFFLDLSYKKRKFVFEYNPSIIVIPEHEKQHSYKHPITGVVTYPVYLTSFRISQFFLCVSRAHFHRHKHVGDFEALGLAFMDENFIILAEAVYEVPLEDVRLITLPSPYKEGQQQIYLSFSKPLSVSSRRAMQRQLWLNKPDVENVVVKDPVYFNSTLPAMPPIYLTAQPNCLTVSEAIIEGKNNAYFEDATLSETTPQIVVDNVTYTTTTTPVVVVETWPPQLDGTHKVSFVELNKPRWCPANWELRATDGELVSEKNISNPIQPSFYTIEEQWFGDNLISQIVPFSIDRGNACCIEMIDPRTNQKVLVGISHTKIAAETDDFKLVPDEYKSVFHYGYDVYLSRFYAFEPTRPYRTVAITGLFCWPLLAPTVDDSTNHYANLGKELFFIKSTNETGSGWCPTIHFVMSFLYKVNSNKSTVLITLGVNDCSPRFIEILASDISQMLFYGISRP